MRKRHSYDRLFEGNILVVFCVIFTVSIFVTVILNTVFGGTFSMSIQNLIWTVVFISAPLLPLALFTHLWKSNCIAENDYLFWIGIPAHYAVSSALTMLFVFIQSRLHSLPLSTYLDALINYTVMYAIVVAGAVVVDLLQTGTANKNLRKIQARQREISKQGE